MKILALLLLLLPLAAETEVVWAYVTAYCPCRKCCGRHANGKTATGKRIIRPRRMEDHWGIAADFRALPEGTRIIVPGYKPSRYFPADHAWLVDDTGGDMKTAWRWPWTHPTQPRRERFIHIDVRFIHHRNAVKWGEKWLRVTIIRRE